MNKQEFYDLISSELGCRLAFLVGLLVIGIVIVSPLLMGLLGLILVLVGLSNLKGGD